MAGELILIVEDDPTLVRGLKDNFEFEGYRTAVATDGEEAIRLATQIKADLIVLDIMLPKVNGYEICRLLRQGGLQTPILMLTAKAQESDVVLGLNLGADDYLTKPFSIKELLARTNAFLRRSRQGEQKVYRFGPFELDAGSRRLLRQGQEIPLTPKEFSLLEFLLRRSGRALTRDELIKNVWGFDVFVTNRSVDRCVTTLRGKIEEDPSSPAYIQTVRQVGYRFEG